MNYVLQAKDILEKKRQLQGENENERKGRT